MSKEISRRGFLVGVGVGAGALALAACSSKSGDSNGGAADGIKITLAISTLNNPFFVQLRDGAQEEAKAQGVSLTISDAQNDSATQLNQLSNAKAGGAQAVIVNPVDSKAVGSGVKALNGSKTPVIAVDRGVEGADVSSFIASDNVAGGRQAGEALGKAINNSGKVIHLQGKPGTSASNDRGKGFTDVMATISGIEVVAKQTANFDRAEALNVVSNLMQAHPDVTAIFAENDEMAMGAIKALGGKAGKDVKVFGFDGTDDGLKAIEAGTLAGSIAQQPKELGKLAIQQALKAIKGSADKEVPVAVKVVTKENVSEFTK
ncbi:MAG: substrate-binding domain-containing protein [Propionibacteriaceae bacterium]